MCMFTKMHELRRRGELSAFRSGGVAIKRLALSAAVSVFTALSSSAATVAYWPLAGENGVRTEVNDVFQNIANPGTMDAEVAYVRSYYGTVNDTSSTPAVCWPVGTNAFPSAYGVYDPVANANRAAATGLDFTARHANANWNSKNGYCWWQGVLRVEDPEAIKTTSFTVEFFFRPEKSSTGLWQFIAAMPMQNISNGSTGTESWSIGVNNGKKIFAVFGWVNENGGQPVRKTYSSVALPQIYDGRWHHFAMTVDGTAMKMYVDHACVGIGALPDNVQYKDDGDLFIGGTTHSTYSYYGSMAHFRISDEALTSNNFLHFARTERAEGEADDVALHIDFEAVDGISTNNVFFNQAATGSAVHFCATNSTEAVGNSEISDDVCTNKLYASRRASAASDNLRSWNRTGNSNGEPCVEWLPSEDIFAESSFTVEMFVKTSTFNAWTHLFKRRTDNSNSNNQIWIGGTGSKNQIKFELNGGPSAITDNSGIVKNGAWHHIAVVYDKDARTLSYYRDWELVASTEKASAVTTPSVVSKLIEIGGSPLNGTYAIYNGYIDDVRITKRALGRREFLTPECCKGLMIVLQ